MSAVFCSSTVHCGCRNLLDATSTTSMAVMSHRLRVVEAERDALARSLDASASTVALLSAQVGRVEKQLRHALARLESAESDAADLAAVGLARFDAAMTGESSERLDRGVSPEMVVREHEALARVIEKLSPTIAALRARAEQAEAERDLEAKLKGEALYQAELEADRATKAETERDEARALKVPPSVDEILSTRMDAATARAERDAAVARALTAEAEVARLQGEYERGLREATGVCDAVESEWKDTDFSEPHRSLARGAVMGAKDCRARILSLLDAAPAAEGE